MNWREVNERNRPRLQGEAGVYRVASELLLRGFNPTFPSVDCGADLIVEGGVRLQIKSGHLRYDHVIYPQGAYWFKLTRGPTAHGNHGLRLRAPRVFSEESDFVVFWGIEQHRFWIVPSPIVDGKSLLIVGPDVAWKEIDVEKVHELHARGLTLAQIGQELGVSPMTVSRRLKGKFVNPAANRAMTYKVRECEGRWDLIESAVDTFTGAGRQAVTTAEVKI